MFETFAIIRHESVPIDKTRNPVWKKVGDPSDNHSAVAVSKQDDLFEVAFVQMIGDRTDSVVQPNGLRVTWPVPFDCRGMDSVTLRPDDGGDGFELFSCVPRSVDEHICPHGNLSERYSHNEIKPRKSALVRATNAHD